MSCSNSGRSQCGGGFEDDPVPCSIKIPDTYMFKCPGDMCDNADNNNNKSEAKEKCDEPEPPKVRPMPKTDCKKCPSANPEPNEGCPPPKPECPPKPALEDNPPPMTTKLPDTKSFKCPGSTCCGSENQTCDEGPKEQKPPADAGCKEDKPKKQPEVKPECKKCGSPVAGKPCNCNRAPIPPTPRPPPCGCKGANCGPNTECDITPLSMKRM